MMSGYKAECRKFQANIFNKSKCTNCFKQREEHSSDALDSNRASRKVSKCGYLFVAPDWDFTIPLYRTKRWQRRWFVLYDDGELTYSVDDLPATIPQGVVDMNRVLEVSSAEDVTGNQYSLAITAPDRVTFVKGTCMEETRWWQDVLSVFPRMHKHGRHKRNATFPGIKGTSGTAASTAAATAVRQPVNRGSDRVPSTLESPVNHRVRFHSISSEHLRATRRPSSAPSLDSTHHHQSLYSSHLHHKSSCSSSSSSSHQYDSVNESSNGSEDDDTANNNQKNSFYSSALSNNNNTTSSSTCSTPNNIQNSSTPAAFSPTFTTSDSYHQSFPYNHNNSSKTITPYHTPIASTQSLHYTRTPPLPTPSSTAASSPLTANPPPAVPASSPPPFTSTPSSKLLMDEHKENTPPYTPDYEDNPPTSESPPTQDKQAHRLRTRRAWNREARALSQPRSEQQQQSSVLADLEASKREEKLKDIAASITTTSSRRRSHHLASQVRGAPDGCGVSEHSSNNSLQRVDLPAEDLLFVKKGWLLTLADNQEWNKYWFVLRGTGLRFYRNASSEEKGILDGIIDLGTAKDIHNLDVGRNYGFVIKTWSEKQHVFSAVTAGIRINWIQALKKAANLKDDSDVELTKTTTKSATIESVSAERDIPIATKCLQAYNNEKNSNYYSYTSSEPLKSISPDNVSNGGKDLKDQQIISTHEDSSLNHQTHINGGLHNRSTMSSDEDEYKTASEASNAINTSHEYADIYELERSRSRNSSGGQNLNNRRTCSSPPTSRRGYGDNFSSVADFTSLGFNKNLLDKYKNMQTMAKARSSTHLSSVEDTVDGGPTKKDASTIRLTDSIKSLDFETTLNDKMSSSVTLASGSGDALLVDLLETQVETLKAKLEATQADLRELHKEHLALHHRMNRQSSQTTSLFHLHRQPCPAKLQALQGALDAQVEGEQLESMFAVLNENDDAKCEFEKNVRELCSAQIELHDKDCRLETAQNQIKEASMELEDAQKQLEDSKKIYQETQNKVIHYQNLLEQSRNELEESQHHLQELAEKSNALETDHVLLQQQHSLCEIQLSNAMQRAIEEVQQKEASEERRARACQDRDQVEAELSTAKNKIVALEEEMEQLMLQQHKRHGVPQDSLRSPISEPESPSFRQPDGRSVQPSRLSNEELTTLEVLQRENATLTRQLTESEAELAEVKETLKCEKSEAYKWKDLVKELRSLLDGKNQDIDKKREEARLARENLRSLQKDYDVTKDRLQRGIEENEALTASLRELQRQLQSQDKRSQPSLYNSKEKFNHTSSNSRRSLPRLASLSDLTNVDFTLDPETLDRETLDHEYCEVRMRLERSIAEIHTLRRQLKESHSAHDSLQLTELQLTQDLTRQKQDSESQLKLMTERVQDLTNKLNNSEKQVRQLRTKMTRAESKDRRRSHSLKGKDSYGLGRDVDVKLSQLEARIDQLMPTIEGVEDTNSLCTEDSRTTEEQSIPSTNSSFRGSKMGRRSRSIDDPGKVGRLRRKSLESSATTDSVKTAVRINSLEAKVAALTPAISDSPQQSLSEVQMRTPSGRSKSRDRNVSRTRRTEGDGRSAAEQTILDSICSQLCECMDWLGLYRCSCGKSDLSSLHQRLSSIHHVCFTGVQTGSSTYSSHSSTEKVHPVAQQVVRLLQSKLSLLADRRQNLKASNSWTKEAQMKNFAERLAYETVLLSQVSQALQLSNQSDLNLDSVKLQDLMESHRKMAFLEKKLTNPEFDLDTMAPLEFYTSMLAEKLVVTGEVLSSVTTGNASHYDAKLKATCRDLQGRLLERESQLARLITRYKEEKLHEVAVVMAQDINSNVDETVLMEEVRIREAWNTAHQLLQQEIVNHQTSQSLLRLSHLLNLKSDNKENNALTSLSLTICSAEAMDRIQTAAEESLRQEMEESVLTLSQKYEEVLSKYRNGDTSLINSVSATIEEVLTEFAGIMAQKAIIDGHLSLLQDEFDKGTIQTTQEPLVISEDNKDIMESVGDVLDSEAHLLMFLGSCDSSVESLVKPAMTQAELTFIFNKYSGQNTSELQELLSQILAQKPEVSEPIISSSSYRSSTRSLIHCSPTASDKDQENLVGTDLPQLRSATSLSKITASPKSRRKSDSRKSRRSSDITGMTSGGCRQCEEYKLELSKYRRKLQPQECPKCPQLLDTIERLEEAQRAVAASRVESSDSDDQLNELKQRLLLIEQGYEEQILRLKQQYEEALSEHPDRCDESMRHKYQTEIEHLRDLCEKGLGTMENSQRRIVSEIKEKHRRELTLLQAEKDQALAEETKATIAALDAMRKAHEAEVQREVAKIKEEFIRKMQSNEDISEITQQHEAEMQDIRQQILSLSEKYSAKCLESANLESQIEGLNKQLSACNKNIRELESRNEKLRDQLTANITGIKGSSSSFDAQTKGQTAESPTKESSKGDAAQKTQTHEAQVLEVCRQLHEYIKCDRPLLSTDHLASLASRLQDLSITASTTDLRDYTERTKRETRPNLRRPKVYSSKELTRSPSCPRLGGSHTPRLVVPRICDDSLDPHSPLSGMVASRKKVFENGDGSLSSHILTPLQVAKISL